MSENMSKAQKRNLRQQVGSAAADVVTSMKDTVTRTELAQQVLARQMLDFETTASRLVESRAVDRKLLEGMREQVESAHAKIGDERTHRLKLADEQRSYVDHEIRLLRRTAGTLIDAADERVRVFESMSFRQRLRWFFTGQLRTPAVNPIAAMAQRLVDAQPPVARDVHEAFWTDLGRPADQFETTVARVRPEVL